ncbi:hypothetical protein [Pectobacterium carotovorum]|uniref:Uncharacterized protein n=1 Tax=Pectobacterium carotovorum TaxID=554 RepID=A0A419AQE4_PECCA|nr:hypothetical protein D5071_20860 [Pectobacterium carotovorum]
MDKLFTSFIVGDTALTNRIAMAPMTRSRGRRRQHKCVQRISGLPDEIQACVVYGAS